MKTILFVAILMLGTIRAAFGGDLPITVRSGFSLIGNPLISQTNVAELIPGPPEGLQVISFDRGSQQYAVNQFQFGQWIEPDQRLKAGECVYFWNPGAAFEIVLRGAAAERLPSIGPGLNFISVDRGETLTAAVAPGDTVYVFADNGGDTYAYDHDFDEWYPPLPDFQAGDGVILRRSSEPQSGTCGGGAIYFNNYQPGLVDARAVIADCDIVGGEGWAAQLALVGRDGTLTRLGQKLPIQAGERLGYFDVREGAVICVPELQPGTLGTFRVLITRDSPELTITSADLTVLIGGGLLPPTALRGLSLNIHVLSTGGSPNLTPEKLEVFEGEPAQFSGFALTPPFQWQKQATNGTWVDLPGETNLVFRAEATSRQMAGKYRMTWTQYCPEATNPAELIVRRRLTLQRTSLSPSAEFTVEFEPESDYSYDVEASSDLINWAVVVSFERPVGVVTFKTPDPALHARRFYRVTEREVRLSPMRGRTANSPTLIRVTRPRM